MLPFLKKRLDELIPEGSHPLAEPARYALLSSGKKLRPLITLATTQVFHTNPLDALDPACAIEMIHCYSLIHDDLPCMDDDDLRRGQPTLHKAFSEGIALLTGDYLLTFALETLSRAPSLPPELKLSLVQTLTYYAGVHGMIGGQAIDLTSVGTKIDEKTLLTMHRGKTAALITASLNFGAQIGEASKKEKGLIQELGEEVGLAYQFQDDLFNKVGLEKNLGKPVGSDAAKNKPTAISLFGVKGTEERLSQYLQSIEEKLLHLPEGAIPLKVLLEQIFLPTQERLKNRL